MATTTNPHKEALIKLAEKVKSTADEEDVKTIDSAIMRYREMDDSLAVDTTNLLYCALFALEQKRIMKQALEAFRNVK